MNNTKNSLKPKAEAIRLVYVELEKTQDKEGNLILELSTNATCPFKLSERMTMDEACYIVSHLANKVADEYGLMRGSFSNMEKISSMITNYGLSRLRGYPMGFMHSVKRFPQNQENLVFCDLIQYPQIADLFFVNGDARLFKYTNLKERGFHWYTKNTSQNTFNKIKEKFSFYTVERE